MPEIKIPFPGLYDSWLSTALDHEETHYAEHLAEQEAEAWPEPLRLDASTIGESVWACVNYPVAHEHLTRAYLDAFDAWAGEALYETRPAWRTDYDWQTGKSKRVRYAADSCGFRFNDMTSPRYYNFQTDRLFAECSMAFVKRLWKRSAADCHRTLDMLIRERFTSYDGFASYYSPRRDDWPRDLAEWDHNQLETLLLACLKLADADDSDLPMLVLEGETVDGALDAGMDYDAHDARLMDARIERLTDWAEADPEAVARWAAQAPDAWAKLRAHDWEAVSALDLPLGDACGSFYRCPETPDMLNL